MDKFKTLSQAIRVGARLRPQGFGVQSCKPDSTHTCVLNAAHEAVFGVRATGTADAARNLGLGLRGTVIDPIKGRSTITEVCFELNDGTQFTREQIADHLDKHYQGVPLTNLKAPSEQHEV